MTFLSSLTQSKHNGLSSSSLDIRFAIVESNNEILLARLKFVRPPSIRLIPAIRGLEGSLWGHRRIETNLSLELSQVVKRLLGELPHFLIILLSFITPFL